MNTAALLIDLENFFLGREHECGDDFDIELDIEALVDRCKQIAGDRRLVVKKAYADYNARRRQAVPPDYYLRRVPYLLMNYGIEPVQVFRFGINNHRNAADMRLAIDATALARISQDIDMFILVTGDSDFLPLVLELKQRSIIVMAIGVTDSTSKLFAAYCDGFEVFRRESTHEAALVPSPAAGERPLTLSQTGVTQSAAPPPAGTPLAAVQAALRTCFTTQSHIVFAAVKPVLTKAIPGFTWEQIGCRNPRELFERHGAALGVQLRQGLHDWEVWPIGSTVMPPPAPPRESQSETTVTHSVTGYAAILASGSQRYNLVPHPDWNGITDLLFQLTHANGERPSRRVQELAEMIAEECTRAGTQQALRKAISILFQVAQAKGLVEVGPEEPRPAWVQRTVKLEPSIRSLEELRLLTQRHLIDVLRQRLDRRGATMDAGVVAEMLFGPEASAAERQRAAELTAPRASAVMP